MKYLKLFAVMAIAGGSLAASGQTTTNINFSANQPVPDGNPVGLTLSTNLSISGGEISSLTLSINVSGGFNGDLYAYLVGPNGGYAVLLNRSGVGTGNSFGYADTGYNITFDDLAASGVHFYQGGSYTINAFGQLTGTWRPDGENLNPLSAPSAFDSQTQNALLGSFDGTDPSGTWTLFFADLSPGAQSTLVSWSLNITTVPEPSALALAGLGFAAAAVFMRKRTKL